MKVFNQGGRKFTHHELQILPGKFTEIPDAHHEGVNKLLKAYPNELITAESADKKSELLAKSVNDLTARNEELKAKVAALEKEPKADEHTLNATIKDLRDQLQTAKTDLGAALNRTRELEKDAQTAKEQKNPKK